MIAIFVHRTLLSPHKTKEGGCCVTTMRADNNTGIHGSRKFPLPGIITMCKLSSYGVLFEVDLWICFVCWPSVQIPWPFMFISSNPPQLNKVNGWGQWGTQSRILIKRHKTDLDINSNTKKVHKANETLEWYPILSRAWPVSDLYM